MVTVSGTRPRRKRVRSTRTLVLYHVTPRRNCPSIDRNGLLPEKSQGRERCIWLCTRTMIPWALAHLARKPGKGSIPTFMVYRVEVSRARVRRRRRGIWTTFERLWPNGCEPASCYTLSRPDDPEPDWEWLAAEAESLDALTNGHFLG